MKKIKSIIKFFNEIIKCFIMINSNICNIIPFYTQTEYNYQENKIEIHCDCQDYKVILLNKKIFDVKNIYSEFDDFVGQNGFDEQIKISLVNSKKIKLNIDEYINNIIWFDFDDTEIDKIIANIKAFDYNYKSFGFTIIDALKKEIVNIPTNKNFQNFLTFLLGIWEDELNTKIDYYS